MKVEKDGESDARRGRDPERRAEERGSGSRRGNTPMSSAPIQMSGASTRPCGETPWRWVKNA